jgi:hypothetical protein
VKGARIAVGLALLAGIVDAGRVVGIPLAAPEAGAIERLEVNSVTRDHAAAWLRVRLPAAAKGSRQSFEGRLSLSGEAVPVKMPVTVMVQPASAGVEAVFLLELDLARATDSLVGKSGSETLDLSLEGTLVGDGASRSAVRARGSLRVGTDAVRAPKAEAASFVRFAGARFSGLTLSETKGEATLVLFNPLGVPLDILEIHATLFVGGRRLADAARQKVRLHPRRENTLVLPVVAGNVDLAAAAGDAAAGGGVVNGRLVGQVTLKTGSGSRVIPVDVPGTVRLLR